MFGHLDADCFYASCERVRHPDLKGKPVGVLGNNGACVIAKSYEMKAFGVKTGVPIWDAKQLCPEGVYVKRDFRWYEMLSRKMKAIVESFFSSLEYYSIDEFFFRALPIDPGERLERSAVRVRDAVLELADLPVTIGIGRSRTLAKLFSDTAKPFGAIAVTDLDHERELLAKLPVTEISGIGSRRAKRLAPYGIRSCLELAKADGKLVRKLLTKTGYEIWLELNGKPVTTIRSERTPHKMLARGGSLMGHISDTDLLWAWTVRNVERLIEELHYHQVRTPVLALLLAWQNGSSTCGMYRFPCPTDHYGEMIDAAQSALSQAIIPQAIATHMHVVAPKLRRSRGWQRSLFEVPDPRQGSLERLKADINERFGRFALRSATTLRLPAVYKDAANEYDICDIRGKFCF